MNIPIGLPARVRAEAQKKKKKEARLARAAEKIAVSAAVAVALRGRGRFLQRLADALVTRTGFTHDLSAWIPVNTALWSMTASADAHAKTCAFLLAVEERAPGLCLLPVGNDVLGRALAHMAGVAGQLVRPIGTFAPRSRSLRGQWDELVAHTCFAFPSPPLLESCFLERGVDSHWRSLAPCIGNGGSWRKVALPTSLSRAAAHHLSSSKQRFATITAAVRDAQAAALGVTAAHLAGLAGFAGASFTTPERDALWLEFFSWLTRNVAVDAVELADIGCALIDVELPFSLHGRTHSSLLRFARDELKNRRLRAEGRLSVGALAPSGIEGGRYVLKRETDGARLFVIEAIEDGAALVEEGIAMRHCVGTYGQNAKAGGTAIFSLRVSQFGGAARRALTIEVDPKQRCIAQVRGKANRLLDDDERAVLLAWMAERELTAEPRILRTRG